MASMSHVFFLVRDGTLKSDYIHSGTVIDLNMDIEHYRDPREYPIRREVLRHFGKATLFVLLALVILVLMPPSNILGPNSLTSSLT